ncbi:hypothetical protein [Paraliomyxa miuraensis]|uniref:hypothetical protein n=1 Tax=Paraliomyxa miuraensis TaxID=376150 RepID=UPI0022538B0D|nr:hypothetical protein [Paraliomyxa miuraensis]MCX4246397.1 hypothetical protein [Paraliomyxa miuraensis]
MLQAKLGLRPRSSILGRLGLTALVTAALAGAPTSQAHAAENLTEYPASDAPLLELRDMLRTTGLDARARMQALVSAAFHRTALRMDVARDRMERMVGFEAWEADHADDDDATLDQPPTPTRNSGRLEYVTDTNDPLAGL